MGFNDLCKLQKYRDFMNSISHKVYKSLSAFLYLLINYSLIVILFYNFFSHIQKCLKIHQLNIKKITKKDYNKKPRKRYQSFSKEEKEKKKQYKCERYKNFPKDKNQRLVEYRKNITK